MNNLTFGFFKKYFKKGFVRNVLITSSGVFFGFIVNFAIQPFITRIYSAEMIGTVALLVSFVGLLNISSSFSYDMAIMRADSVEEASKLTLISLCILILFSSIVSIILGTSFDSLFGRTKYNVLNDLIIFIPIFLLMKGLIKITQNLLIRTGDFKNHSVSDALKTTSPAMLKIIFGKVLSPTTFLLLISTLIGSLLNGIFLLNSLIKQKIKFSFTGVLDILKKYRKYPMIFNWNNLLNSLAQQSTILLLGFYYDISQIGYYSLAMSVILMPIGFMSNSIFKVYLPNITTKYKNGLDLMGDFRKLMIVQLLIGAILFITLFVLAPFLFEFVFGKEWRQSGIFVRLLTPWMFMMFLNKPSNAIIQLHEKFKFLSIYNVIILILRVCAIFLGFIIYNDILWSIGLFSLVGFLCNFYFIIYSIKIIR
ncbi:MAG: hypothetical protein BM564_12980 [Bacteroidetes bacterium MedPE-SWsnd-G2]|nr:MAG: hypothetical protein BM564_12980 [Bacteroidetes bacterium MedPE-SWsnd-G2]